MVTPYLWSDYTVKSCRTLWDSMAQKSFCVSHFLTTRNRLHSAPMTHPWVPKNKFKQFWIREGRGCKETIVQPWVRVLIPLQGIHRIFELFCRHWHPQQVGKVNCLLPTSTETPDWLKPNWQCWLPLISPPIHQKCWSHPFWTITIKLLTTPSRLGHIVLTALSHCGLVCLAKQ